MNDNENDIPSPGYNEVPTERALLGALLQDATRLVDVAEILGAEDFYRPEHGATFGVLLELLRADTAIDIITVTGWITSHRLDDRCGGAGYVVELPEHAPSTQNVVHYAETIRRAAELRRIYQLAPDMSRAALGRASDVGRFQLDAGTEPTELVAAVTTTLLGIVARRADRTEGSAEDVIEVVNVIHDDRAGLKPPGMSTGIVVLDELLDGGPRPSNLVILGGRPGMGKTALAMNITEHRAADLGEPVGWISMEMSRAELLQRLLATVANIPLKKLRTPKDLTEHEVEELEYTAQQIKSWPIWIDDRSSLTIAEIRAVARKWKARGVKLIVLDYLQLCEPSHPKLNKTEAMGEVSKGCKAIAKDLDIPFLLLSQLNRDVEKRPNKRPLPVDLRDSGQIEQDADQIWFCYRDCIYNPDTADPRAAEIIVAKYRAGATGTAKCAFDGAITRFRDYGPDDLL